MTDPKQVLTEAEVREASLDDWRELLGRIKARFRTGDFATGLALVNRIGAAAEAANHHPEVALSYTDVIVTLNSHDVGGVTARDIDLAREISGFAAELGANADIANLTMVELGLDTASEAQLTPFYETLLGSTAKGSDLVDPSGQAPTVWWQHTDRTSTNLPEQGVEQRWHLDVWVPHDEAPRRVQAVIDAGGRLVSDDHAPAFWVLEDADGNRSCICSSLSR